MIKSLLIYIWIYMDWFFALLLMLFTLKWLEQAWLFYRQNHYKRNTPYVLYEIIVPRELEKGPAGMDQFFSALYGIGNWPGSFGETYYDGETTRPFAFELVGINGSIHMFMRVPRYYGDAIKAALFAQYNNLEIREVEDYMNHMPRSYKQLSDMGYEMWGVEINAEEKYAYPIRTYAEFEQKGRKSDERDVDPVAFFNEFIQNLPSDEALLLQFVVKPALPDWK